jgi:tight adherence protein B
VGIAPWKFVVFCVSVFLAGAVVMLAVSGVVAIGLLFGLMAGASPVAILRGRAARRRREYGALWPDAVDNLTSAVRAGLSLPDALMQLGERGPEGLREPFVQFGHDYQSSGRFDQSLNLLKDRLADPTGDRVVEALRIARDVGGGDLGRVLRSLSGFLRDDQRTRGEIEARQSWTVTGARLAVAAPWTVLLLMCFQGDVISRFAAPTGLIVLGGGAVTCIVAYRLMMWIGRLPAERRILA